MKRRRVTGLLMAAVLAVSSCPGGFSAAAAEPDALMETGEASGIPEEIEPVSDADAVLPDEAAEAVDLPDGAAEEAELPDEAAEDAQLSDDVAEAVDLSDDMAEDLITEMELPDDVIEEAAAELFDDPDGFPDDGIFEEEILEGEEAPVLGDAYDVFVRVEPADYGYIVRYNGRCKEFETGTAADGTLIDPFSVEPANQDKLKFSHWELNGTTLVAGENCEVSEEEYYFTPDLVKLDPALLTSEMNVLTAHFIPYPGGELGGMNSFSYKAGEGGMLENNGGGYLQKEIINYFANDSLYSGYDVVSSYIIAVPDEGYQFFRWVDAMGNTVSTEAEISELDAKKDGEYTSPFITNYIDAPYTAEFKEEEAPVLGDAYDVFVRVEPADYGYIVRYNGRCKEFETGTAADGSLIDPFSVEPANQDKLKFSHWTLNGTTLVAGENCEVSEEEYYFTPDLVKLDPALLTSDRNVLTAVFIPNPNGEIAMDSFWYQAGEGGMLEENGSGCLQKEITNYIAYDSIYSGYDVISSCIIAVPDDGYQFFRWVDAMGNTVSTEAEISQLDAKSDGKYTSPFVTNYVDSPYTAEFKEIETEVVSTVTVTWEPDDWGSVAKVKGSGGDPNVHWSRPMPEKEAFTMPVIKDGSFPFTGLLPTVENIDKVAFSHWELNGQELVNGETCTYQGQLLTNIDVSLLTGENDVLTAVFKPYGEMIQDPVFFYASEGGHLETDDDGISYSVVRNYAAMFEYMYASYDNVHNYVKAVAHEGYAFAGWKDKNGNIVSTDPLISDLDACTYDETNVEYYEYTNEFMKRWEDAPFTAVFDKLEDEPEDDTILVTTEPYGWGEIYYTSPDGNASVDSRIEDFPIAKDGKLFSVLSPMLTRQTDRMFFSHWTLNGKKLAPGTDCTYIYDMDNEPVGLEAVNPALLTGNDILTAVFVKSQYDDMTLDLIRFRASEGGALKAEDWSEPYDELYCYAAITEPKWKGYNTLYNRITAVPDKGWRFIRWEGKNGEVISTEALVDDLNEMDGPVDYASAFIRSYQSSPFTAVFEELGTLTIKVSANGAEIPDTASFTVTGPEGYEKTLAYSAFTDGEYTLEDLVPGTYTVKEDEASAALDSFELEVSYPENGEALIAKEALNASVSIENAYTEKTDSDDTGDDEPEDDTILVTTEPYGWGKIYYTRPDGVQGEASRIEGFPIAKDGKLFSVLSPMLTRPTDRMFFSHWTLNGKKLAPGTDCTYIYDMDNEPVGLEAVNPALLTGNDILTAVFVKSAYDDMVLETIRFRASEGGALKAEDWSEPYDELYCYVAITEPKWKGYNTLYNRITAVPDKGWRFIRWEDKNGEVISTKALVDDLREMDGPQDYASAFIRSYQSSPFTAVFEELGTLTIKVSAKGAEIPATASFTVTGPEGFEKKLTYNKFTDGECTLEDLVPGTYTVKEDEASAALDSYELAVSYPENGEALIAKEALKVSVSIENTYTEKTISGSTGDQQPGTGPAVTPEEAALKALDDQILNIPTEESPDALYGKLYFRVMGVGKHAIKLRWRKINGATGYVLYGGPCKGKFQRIGMVTTNRCTVNKLKKGTYYKFKLVAVKQTGKGLGVEMISKVVHEVTAGGKLGNPRGISFSGKKKVTLKKGKSARISAKAVLPAGLRIRVHRKLCFESSNPAVATVTRKGKIKAVGKGNATIYVYAQNGICRQVKVRVK